MCDWWVFPKPVTYCDSSDVDNNSNVYDTFIAGYSISCTVSARTSGHDQFFDEVLQFLNQLA